MGQFILGLDIGTVNIKGVIGGLSKTRKPYILQVFKKPSSGVRKGVVVDTEELTDVLCQIVNEIKSINRSALENVFVNIGNHQTNFRCSRGFIALSRVDSEISNDDIERSIQASAAIRLPSNRSIIHIIPREFFVDAVAVKDPSGLFGTRLEVDSLIIDAFSPVVKNLSNCLKLAGISDFETIFSPLAGARAVLSKTQSDLGVVLIDIGAGTTGLSVFEENKLLHTVVFPIGSANITNDIAIGFKTNIEIAEKLKYSFAFAQFKELGRRDTIDLVKISPELTGSISRRFLSEIIEVRLAEILELVNNELIKLGKAAKLPGGIVIVGGGAKIPGVLELVKKQLKLPVQIGTIQKDQFGAELDSTSQALIEDPEFASAVGLFLWGCDEIKKQRGPAFGLLSKVGQFFKQFLP